MNRSIRLRESTRGRYPAVRESHAACHLPAKTGMIAFLVSEASFFGTLIMAYVYFLSQSTSGDPRPSQVFHLPLVLAASACLFSSSATIHLAEKALASRSSHGRFSSGGV